MPASYKPPTAKAVRTELLDLNHARYMERNIQELEKEADVFGLAFLGDGATVKRMLLLNVLASGKNAPATVLEIVDCTGHLSNGGKKDASFIANTFLPHLAKLDPKKTRSDLSLFDGAGNIQKGGEILSVKYPRMTVLHGVEHVASLFFADLAKIKIVRVLILKQKRRYNTFGSGAIHGAHAIFKMQAKLFNKGKDIGLLRAADTRMAGYFMAMHRDLRMRRAL